MTFRLLFTREAAANLERVDSDPGLAKRAKAVRKCLALLESNPRHPGLQTHEFRSLEGPAGEKVLEAYAEQKTPAAYRIFWRYGPGRQAITIIAITAHP